MIQNANNQRGIALPIVLSILVIITLLGFTAMSLTENQTIMVTRHQQHEKALYYAEAGVYRYINLLNDNRDFYENPESDNLFKDKEIAFESGYYELTIIPPTVTNPAVTIQSKGWTAENPKITRTLKVSVYKREFVQNLFVSESENSTSGEEIWWVRGDIVNGPLHTNGNLSIDGTGGDGSAGPEFNGPVTYSGVYKLKSGTQTFNDGAPQKVSALKFPKNNSNFRSIAEGDGYLYTGRTCIYINENNLTIRNKNNTTETRSFPPQGVIYVDGGTGDKWSNNTANVFVSGKLDGRLTIAAANDIYITAWDPTNWQEPLRNWFSSWAWSGWKLTPKGAYTGGITYKDYNGSNIGDINDMLGLVAGNYVRILHNGWPRDNERGWHSSDDVAPNNITIHAAIFALNNSFEYEAYNDKPVKDTLTIVGSITQKNRGAVGTFITGEVIQSGYSKSYSHDPRMLYDMPPHFLEPMNSGWEIREWKEL